MPAAKNNKKLDRKFKELCIYLIAVLLMLLSAANLNIFFNPVKSPVLGAVSVNTDGIFWYDFLNKYPDYIPGWIEIGRLDKVEQIDPNYF